MTTQQPIIGDATIAIIPLREPQSGTERTHADRCDGRHGSVRTRGGQDVVSCAKCGSYVYNAPKVETGRKTRTVTTVHNGLKPSIRARVLMRATGRCEMCGSSVDLHVGHLVSVADGVLGGLTESFLNGEENLAAFCAECNLGMGVETVPLRLAVAILRARSRRTDNQAGESR